MTSDPPLLMNTAITLPIFAHKEIFWVGWKKEAQNGRLTEVLCDPKTGRIASVYDPATWATHDEADDGRSGRAFRIGLILAATGAPYEDMSNAWLTYANLEISGWARTKGMANGEHEFRRIYGKARGRRPGVQLEDFIAYMQTKGNIYLPAGDVWPAQRVNERLPPLPQIAGAANLQ